MKNIINSTSRSAFFHPRVLTGFISCAVGLLLAFAGLSTSVAGPSAAATQTNPVPLINQPLVPDAVAPGGAGFTLTVNGTGFVSGSVANWNGSARPTTFVSNSQLAASILASDIATDSTALVTVVNPSPGGGNSNIVFFTITLPTSTVSLTKSDYATGLGPYMVVTADFNMDGKLDLAITSELSQTVSILLGNGDGTFQLHADFPTSHRAGMMIARDFNGDGKLDLAVANGFESNTVSVLLGNGDGTFTAAVDYATGSVPLWLTTGDFNADGKLDLAISDFGDFDGRKVSILIGNGDGTFGPHVDYATGGLPRSVTTGDFNGDGKLDLALPNQADNTVSILLGNGDGTFQRHIDYATGATAQIVTTGDFNADGNSDLAVTTDGSSAVSILLGNRDGTFPTHVEYATGGSAFHIAIADLNGDGKLDLAVNGVSLNVLLGNGDGTFQSHVDYAVGSGPVGVTIGDFNGDGRLDLAEANFDDNTASILLQGTSVTEGCLPPPAGLVSWWSGDKTAQDVQGTNPGRLVGGASFTKGMVGPGFLFDGINDLVNIPNSTSLSQTRITLDAWVYITGKQGAHRHIISKDNDSKEREYILSVEDDNKFAAFVGLPTGAKQIGSTTIAQPNTWYHVAMSHDGVTLRLYVNGVLETTLAAIGDMPPTPDPVGIGGNTAASVFFQGIIDEAQIFSRALTDAEILAIYQAGADGQCKPEIFVSSITPSYEVVGRGFLISTSIVIQDENGVGIENASLQIKTILPSGSVLAFPATTDSTGEALISFAASDSGLYRFAVRKVTHATREYDPSLNVETSDTLIIP